MVKFAVWQSSQTELLVSVDGINQIIIAVVRLHLERIVRLSLQPVYCLATRLSSKCADLQATYRLSE